MKTKLVYTTLILALCVACVPPRGKPSGQSVPGSFREETITAGEVPPQTQQNNTTGNPTVQSQETGSIPQPQPQSGDENGILLFDIGMHIEPFGASPSTLVGPDAIPGGSNKGDYTELNFFQRHVADLQKVADIIKRHGGSLTIQAQTPFTTMAISNNNSILADLARDGHEIALHFHEDAHLGKNTEKLSTETWCAVMKEELGFVQQASGVSDIHYFSGGNLYPAIYQAADCAGLDVHSDWKSPETQTTPLEMTGILPWRPAGGTDGRNIAQFIHNDPQGSVIYLPEGIFDSTDFASRRDSKDPASFQGYFDYLEQSFRNSLDAARSDRVNVFHFTIHIGEFRGNDQQPFAVIDQWLTDVIDPLVASGKVKWATFSQMADAFRAWEQANPGVDPRTVE